LEDENKQIQQELEQVTELTEIKGKEEEILQRQAATIANDYGMQLLRQKLGRLLEELRKSGSSTVDRPNLILGCHFVIW
jgi:Tfp pilus assembly PilM family ATPase